MKITVPKILDLKSKRQITMMTAYDFPTSKAISEAGIDVILVGDSLAQVVLGHDDTLSVTMDEMLHHVKAVTRAKPDSLVVADMPYMSYHTSKKEAIKNAARFIQEGNADAVKLEGGFKRKDVIESIINAEIPVMGHLGLTPQSKNMMGGYKVQGKTLELATELLEEAVLLENLGCFSMVLEGVPSVVAEVLTEKVSIPTIGIGAGVNVDGQVLVFHDFVGMKSKEYIDAKFVKRYSNQHEQVVKALEHFKKEVENKEFPTEHHSYEAGEITQNDIKEWKKEIKKILS
ncbi:MAG: 3-methyl-2-oxobutanoate hydroxymethyltransferase [Candidatus Pelagibacter sp. TMED239]|uniref:3-methyl-2-oxobutanoate hydroxymethyltransferase n=1 Tax=Candidatus Actinomarina minuta TaxID=1389454 RepID=S5DXR6_9ACTN|nr:ketopantoate hydroxymethyltransferase [Candidatus Actinomarina minuta]RPG97158.1 MAG: 3-methyl-2-oxobutanoate hydroxymethyltransferase [Candidatus Pelagibacter sp. TMED239]|tara:strand:+ start:73 stop:936 length:864 start_codon:yes stop_codon:yes gene_type:complete